jgi:hypothetical protein
MEFPGLLCVHIFFSKVSSECSSLQSLIIAAGSGNELLFEILSLTPSDRWKVLSFPAVRVAKALQLLAMLAFRH